MLPLDRRAVLTVVGAAWLGSFAGCLDGPSSGGPPYETREVDDGSLFGPGLQDENERAYYAALVADAEATSHFDWEQAGDADRAFVEETDFAESYLGLVQVGQLTSSMRFEVVDCKESDVNLTVVLAVRDDEPHSDDRVITTLLFRMTSDRRRVPENVAVELDVGDHHETFSGGRAGTDS
ncbi:hypothetical protein ACFO0N_08350 [Halobium salinum]|uniref:Uncharacterized protein n=1 Tax=Halobium salinum TaxID=1364940 RepID=A0ABD5PAR5_9EURY|nr:hypothetical protein [Halobium salinum]